MRTSLKQFLMWLWRWHVISGDELTLLIKFFDLKDA